MSPGLCDRLTGMKRIEDVLARHVTAGDPTALAWAVLDGDDLHAGALGAAERDTIFRIASMTKPITAVATMLLVEDCVLRLDDPVDDLLPELANQRVLRDPNGALDDTVPAERPITTRDLLTFTWGLGLDFTRFGQQPAMDALAAASGVAVGPPSPAGFPTADHFMRALGDVPLEFQPGERWEYHVGSEVLGVLIERAAGQPFDAFLRDRIFEPIDMRDTAFHVPPTAMDRFGPCGGVGPDGARFEFDDAGGQWSSPPPFCSGGGGLVSTVDDYAAFARMLLHGGDPVLSRPSVELMTSNHLSDAQLATAGPSVHGDQGWGFGVGVIVGRRGFESVGSYGWTGGLGSSWTNDPARGLGLILLTDTMFTSPELPVAHRDFVTAAYASLDG
jgi:CubicO group peptidase (beta-lactamase class C family)